MTLPRDRNDRVLLATVSAIALISALIGASITPLPTFADPAPSKPAVAYKMLPPATGPVPHAHNVSKIVKTDDPISIVRDPADLPPPIGARGPKRVKVDLQTIEVTGRLSDGATYRYWTFNQKVPGPFIRVRVGDTVEVG